MKHAGMLIFVLLLSFAVRAQENVPNFSEEAPAAVLASSLPQGFEPAGLVSAALPAALPEPAGASFPQVSVQSVFPSYSWQLYGGYTFIRVYAFPGREVNRNGFDLSISYYPHSGHFGVEGAETTAFGSVSNGGLNEKSDFVFAGGGLRFRWSAPRGTELWAHGLAGDANFGPSIASFSQNAIAYELGGGLDVNAHRQRLALRFEADMVGTRFYTVTQYSPKFSVGLVFKF